MVEISGQKLVPLTALISIYLWVFLKDQSRVLFILYTYTCVIFMQKILSFNKIWQCPAYKCWGDQLSSRKYEELLGILIDHKCTFEDQLLNIVQNINQEYQSTCLKKRSWQFAYCSLIWIIHSRQINHNKFHERVIELFIKIISHHLKNVF